MQRNPLKILGFVLKTLLRLNLFQTLYFNFKWLPINQAFRLPVHIYGKVKWANKTGRFLIQSSEIKFGMIVIGAKHEIVICPDATTRIYNAGTVIFKGSAKLARGINLTLLEDSVLTIGKNFSIGSLSRIIVFRKISFGDQVLISWETQFFDTDFHYLIDTNKEVKDNCSEVNIGNHVWIGTRVTVLKGTQIANKSVVAAGSVCSGNYTEKYGESALLAGTPARFIKGEIDYIADKKQERKLMEYFKKNPDTKVKWEHW